MKIKICGVKTSDAALAAARAGAGYVGFVFFRKSPRYISPEAAEEIIVEMKNTSFDEGFEPPKCVGLFVDAGEKELSEAAAFLTHFQFHGHESPERCEELRSEFATEIIRAIAIENEDSFAAAKAFQDAADLILFDAKAPPGAARPGGHGAAFNWDLLKAYDGETPFLLAGGLTPGNVAEAVKSAKNLSSFAGVDVSSGVESAPGVKDLELIKAFITEAKKAG